MLFFFRNVLHFTLYWLLSESRFESGFIWCTTTRGRSYKLVMYMVIFIFIFFIGKKTKYIFFNKYSDNWRNTIKLIVLEVKLDLLMSHTLHYINIYETKRKYLSSMVLHILKKKKVHVNCLITVLKLHEQWYWCWVVVYFILYRDAKC